MSVSAQKTLFLGAEELLAFLIEAYFYEGL